MDKTMKDSESYCATIYTKYTSILRIVVSIQEYVLRNFSATGLVTDFPVVAFDSSSTRRKNACEVCTFIKPQLIIGPEAEVDDAIQMYVRLLVEEYCYRYRSITNIQLDVREFDIKNDKWRDYLKGMILGSISGMAL
jgi:predicted RNA-binding protein Jag